MTIRELDAVTTEDIYIRSLHGMYEGTRPDKTTALNNVLRAFAGIMDLTIYKTYYTPENCGLIVYVDLPPKVANALHGIGI